MALRSSFLIEIEGSLKNEYFNGEDFFIEDHGDSDNEAAALYIEYKYDKSIYIKIRILAKGKVYYDCSPGEILDTDESILIGVNDIPETVAKWVHRLGEEIQARPEMRAINEHKSTLNDFISKFEGSLSNLEDRFFTKEDAEECIRRLTKLEEEFQSHLEGEFEDKHKLEEEKIKLSKEIELLKSQASSLTRSNWLRLYLNKLFNWGIRNPKTVKALGGMAIEMLPASVKDSIPKDVLQLEVSEQ